MSEQTNKRTRAGDKKASKRDRNKNKRPFQRNVNDFENYLCLKIGSLIAKLREKKICTKRLIKKQYIDQTVKICLRDKMEKIKMNRTNSILLLSDCFFFGCYSFSDKKKTNYSQKLLLLYQNQQQQKQRQKTAAGAAKGNILSNEKNCNFFFSENKLSFFHFILMLRWL